MKIQSPRFIACFLFAAQLAGQAADFQPQYASIGPGLDYAHLVTTNEPWSIHVARVDQRARSLEILATLAQGTIQGLSTVANQADSVLPSVGRPVAAVNGDFFVIKPGPYQGDPQGLQILAGEIISTPGQASFWTEHRHPHIEKIESKMQIRWRDGKTTRLGLNETPRTNGVVLFTPIFGASTRATNSVELVIEGTRRGNWLPLRASNGYRARVKAINNCGNTRLEPGLAVVTLGEAATNLLAGIGIGSVLEISTALSKNLKGAETAIGGGPMLVRGAKEVEWPVAKGALPKAPPRHPRTAVGINRRYLFLVEVDGRQPGLSVGMTFHELADLMKQLGCTEAMNLDGGGSSTFWLDGKVMNSPSDKHERTVANALVVVRKGARR